MQPFQSDVQISIPSVPSGRRPVVVAISGGTASGKSTFARELAAHLSDLQPFILMQDRYFRDFAEYSDEKREIVRTANHPDAIHWSAFHQALTGLCAGQAIVEPAPGTRPYERGETPHPVGPAGVVLIEGLFALWDERCRNVSDLKLYLEANDEERVLRRIQRNVVENGGSLEPAIAWYRRDVMPNYPLYTAATRRYADLIVATDHSTKVALRAIASAIRAQAGQPMLDVNRLS
ncbi:MAG TPA: uridine kinase [Chloroflexota bacterium]|nr:uridine kinase [Chloroflexota bacterium]